MKTIKASNSVCYKIKSNELFSTLYSTNDSIQSQRHHYSPSLCPNNQNAFQTMNKFYKNLSPNLYASNLLKFLKNKPYNNINKSNQMNRGNSYNNIFKSRNNIKLPEIKSHDNINNIINKYFHKNIINNLNNYKIVIIILI